MNAQIILFPRYDVFLWFMIFSIFFAVVGCLKFTLSGCKCGLRISPEALFKISRWRFYGFSSLKTKTFEFTNHVIGSCQSALKVSLRVKSILSFFCTVSILTLVMLLIGFLVHWYFSFFSCQVLCCKNSELNNFSSSVRERRYLLLEKAVWF